jgi:hypothetical protein
VAFNSTFRYIDDVLSINNNQFHSHVDSIYPNELEIKDTTESSTSMVCFTTTHACLHLYETLQPLEERELYFDKDSIIYQHDDSQFNPTIIHILGGWTDELSGDHITKIYTCLVGPKNYDYETEGGKSVCKVKGIAPLRSP